MTNRKSVHCNGLTSTPTIKR